MKRSLSILLLSWFAVVFLNPVCAQGAGGTKYNPDQKIALVIGNSDYNTGPLLNPVNDARSMADALREVDFEVMEYLNMETMSDMKRAIRDFGKKIQNGGVGLVYYAGHGVQVGGRNYLMPTHAEIYAEEEVEYEAVDVGFVIAQMEIARNRMNIVILDACRNNPFARSWRSASDGLATVIAPTGTLIAYATAPGSVASDGTGDNGLYTEELLKQINQKGKKIEDVFKSVRAAVVEKSSGQQTPWESSSLVGDFYFKEPERLTTSDQGGVLENKLVFDNEPLQESTGKDLAALDVPNENLDAQWKSEDLYFNFLVNGVNIAKETHNAAGGDHLIVYHPPTEKTYLFESFYDRQDGKYREAKEIDSPSGAFWLADDSGYWIILKGEDISSETTNAWRGDDLLVYYPSNGKYYMLGNYNSSLDKKLKRAELAYTNNGTLWCADEEMYYWIYDEGEYISLESNSRWKGNDLIVSQEKNGTVYLLEDFYNKRDEVMRPATTLASPRISHWKREDNYYYLYRNGQSVGTGTVSAWAGDHLLVYEDEYQITYLFENYRNADDGTMRTARILFSPDNIFFFRKENTYYLYINGENIAENTTNKWNETDLEVYDPDSDRWYVLEDYANADDGKIHVAKLK